VDQARAAPDADCGPRETVQAFRFGSGDREWDSASDARFYLNTPNSIPSPTGGIPMRNQQPTTPSVLSTLTDAAIAQQMDRFRQRLAAGELTALGIPIGTIKRLDSTGDTELCYPRVAADQLATLPLDAQVAVAVAERLVREAQASRQRIVATAPGAGHGAPLADFLPHTAPETIVILSPIVGG
jgi:hypothetical protein